MGVLCPGSYFCRVPSKGSYKRVYKGYYKGYYKGLV